MNQDMIALALDRIMPVARATGLFVSLATFQAPSGNFTDGGAPDGNFADVAGLVAIPCMAPPPSDSRIQATEVRALTEITASELHHVLLNDYYPAVDQGWRGDNAGGTGAWRVLVDGYAYDIMGVESDSQSRMTRVQVKLATI